MTAILHPANTPLGRFGIATVVDSADLFEATIPVDGLVNPITGAPTLAPLAVLVDYVAGLVNHHRRGTDEWTLSRELTVELTADALAVVAASPGVPVVGRARPFGTKGASSLGRCELSHGDSNIGIGTVRSVHIKHSGTFPQESYPLGPVARPTELAAMMAVRVSSAGSTGDSATDGAQVLWQTDDATLNNSLAIVHGGIAAAGLELVASAALNAGRAGEPLQTASLTVSYVHRFFAGNDSHYRATVLRSAKRSGISAAEAVGADGRVALLARLSAYV